jgi:chemotaxis methyl-accepting protein methylase
MRDDRRPATPVPGLPLATGNLAPHDAAELEALLEQIHAATGLRGTGYKERYLRRRLGVRMRRLGLDRYGDYAALLKEDAAEYEHLLDAIAINVSRFWRNGEVWQVLRDTVVPELLAADEGPVRMWSAGAASGEEAHTLAMIVEERRQAMGAAAPEVRILGTDLDPQALARARRGTYPADAVADLPPELRDRWLESTGGVAVSDVIRRMVDFRELDLTTDAPPPPQHLVLCRNVLIYFERDVQEGVLARIAGVVPPGGFLVLGQAEMLVGPARDVFRPETARERIYRRA